VNLIHGDLSGAEDSAGQVSDFWSVDMKEMDNATKQIH
jgi:hypothetical protein